MQLRASSSSSWVRFPTCTYNKWLPDSLETVDGTNYELVNYKGWCISLSWIVLVNGSLVMWIPAEDVWKLLKIHPSKLRLTYDPRRPWQLLYWSQLSGWQWQQLRPELTAMARPRRGFRNFLGEILVGEIAYALGMGKEDTRSHYYISRWRWRQRNVYYPQYLHLDSLLLSLLQQGHVVRLRRTYTQYYHAFLILVVFTLSLAWEMVEIRSRLKKWSLTWDKEKRKKRWWYVLVGTAVKE